MPARCFLRAKIHGLTLTGADVAYEGSMALCPELLRAAGILPFERIDVYNLDNGERLTTYAIEGGPKEACLNGAAALKGAPGQRVIVAAYAWLEEGELDGFTPVVVHPDGDNAPASVRRHAVRPGLDIS